MAKSLVSSLARHLLSFFSNEPPLARRLRTQTIHSIDSFPDTVVGRIVGVAGYLEEQTLIAPLSGRTCAAWFVRIGGADSRVRGHTAIIEARRAASFTVSDATGRAVVHADDTSLLLAFDVTETLGIARRPPKRLVQFLREQGSQGSGIGHDWRMGWQEGIIAEGQRVAVVGRGRREIDPVAGEGGYRKAATRLVMRRSGEDEELFVSTFDGALG